MHQIRDTFLHFIADNVNVPVHVLRDDPDDRSASDLQMNAVNLSFGRVRLNSGANLSSVQAFIDVINDDENTAVDWMQTVWGVLSAAFLTPILDYSDPTSPAATGHNISWSAVAFDPVASKSYAHYSCSLMLSFSAIT